MALMRNIIDFESSNFQEVAEKQVWRDAMVEYISIAKNDVWNIVPSCNVPKSDMHANPKNGMYANPKSDMQTLKVTCKL